MSKQHPWAQRLLIVSNRLPFTVSENKSAGQSAELTLVPSSGGLVSGLTAYLDTRKDVVDNGVRRTTNDDSSRSAHRPTNNGLVTRNPQSAIRIPQSAIIHLPICRPYLSPLPSLLK